MKKVLIVAALAALVATPAAAKHSHNAPVALPQGDLISSDVALRGASVMGQDPDARVRFELSRDNPFY